MQTAILTFGSVILSSAFVLFLAKLMKRVSDQYALDECENDDEYLGEDLSKNLIRKIEIDEKLTERVTNKAYYEQMVN
jgi:hypothetical protein